MLKSENLSQVVQEFQISERKLYSCSDDFMEAYLDFIDTYHESYYPKEPKRSREFYRKHYRSPPPSNLQIERYFVIRNGKVLGEAVFEMKEGEQEQNLDFAYIEITVHPNYIQRGIGKLLFRKLIKCALKHDKRKLTTFILENVNNGKTEAWLKKLNVKHVSTEISNRVYKADINFEWIEKTLQRKFPTDYHFSEICKATKLDKIQNDSEFRSNLADFQTEVFNNIPRGDSDKKDTIVTPKDLLDGGKASKCNPWDTFEVYAFDKKKIIGTSETYFPKNEPVKDVGTGLTGIRKAYYKQGIASFMKAKVVKYFIDNHPDFEYLFTENSNVNEPMLKINHNIGFKEHFRWLQYEGTVKSYLEY